MITKTVQTKLKQARLESGLKWPFFASRLDISQDVLKKIQSGKYVHEVCLKTRKKLEAIGIMQEDWQ